MIINAMERGDFKVTDFQKPHVGIVKAMEEAVDRLGRKNEHSPKSRASYTNRVNQFIAFLAQKYPKVKWLADLKPEMGQEYIEWRRSQLVTRSGKAKEGTPRNKPSQRTVSDDVGRFKTLFSDIAEHEKLGANPFEGVRAPSKARDSQSKPMALSRHQVQKLLAAAEAYDHESRGPGSASTFRGMMRDMLAFYLLTGLRKDELIHLPWSKVDLENEGHGAIEIGLVEESVTLRVAPTQKQAGRIGRLIEGKSPKEKLFKPNCQFDLYVPQNYVDQEKERLLELKVSAWLPDEKRLLVPTVIHWNRKATAGSVPLTIESRAILERRKTLNQSNSPFVFPHPDTGPLRSDPLPEFKKILKNAGLPQSTRIHDLRHTFGFTLREKEVRIETIMGLMRHANIKETMVYATYSIKEGAQHIQQMDELIT